MKLLDKLEKQRVNHPLKDEDFETKTIYLNAIAFFITIDDVIDESKKEKFDEIINLLDCENVREDLFELLENPNEDELEDIFEFIKKNDLSMTYLLEIFFLHSNTKMNESEELFLNMIANTFKYNEADIFDIFTFINSVRSNSKMKLKQFINILHNDILFQHEEYRYRDFINFYKIDDAIKEKLYRKFEKAE